MKVMQSSLFLFFALVIQVLTSVATNPSPTASISRRSRGFKKYHAGDIKPSAWEQAEGKTLNHGSTIEHPGVVLGQNLGSQKYKVANILHNLPAKYAHRDDASKYYKKASMINTGTPAAEDLNLAKRPWGWNKISRSKLRDEINKNYPGTSLRRRSQGCPPKQLSSAVTNGLPPGPYRICSINTAANHQSAIVPVAQRGSLDDHIHFTVGHGGAPGNNKNHRH